MINVIKKNWYSFDFLQICRSFFSKFASSVIKLVICMGVFLVVAVSVSCWEYLLNFRESIQCSVLGFVFILSCKLFMITNVFVLLWRIILVWQYKPEKSVSYNNLPKCTVVVPAYNEGKQVLPTLESIVLSDYPAKNLQIIAVDDGSVDDTFYWIQKAAQIFKNRINTVRLPKNKGKRHALYEGIIQSRGDVIVTVDSDSILAPHALRSIVTPLVRNKKVGAVAGNVRVLNIGEGIIPCMLNVIFLYSFNFIRASQSMVNTVMCTPGAISAYRRDIVTKVLSEWLSQTFCGKDANIGEDRAMTNLILREGYYVRFQQNAKVYTNVPVKYSILCKMLLRWARSNVRETIVTSKFVFCRFRKGSMTGARINHLTQLMSLTTSQLLFIATFVVLFYYPLAMGMSILLGITVMSSLSAGIYVMYYKNSDFLWAYAYGLFWFACLSWITPYALITPHKSRWMTREK